MKKILLVALLLTFGLSSCGTSTSTPVPPAIETSLPPTATLQLLPTSTALIFRDDFEGPLSEGWQWTREDRNGWSLSAAPGCLEIMAGFGSISGGNISNLLLRQVPEGNFELETSLKFKPTEEQQFAGLLVYENAANFIQFGRGLCIAPQCVGDGFYFELMSGGSLTSENFAAKAADSEIVYLRLRFDGNAFTAYVSEDGKGWQLIGTHQNKIKPSSVGLIAGQAFSRSAQTPAQFDDFVINALP